MFYVILIRILRRYVFLHLVVPLAIGVLVEAVYTRVSDKVPWDSVPQQLLSGHRIALYVGVVAAYVLVIGLRVRSETNVGLRRLELNALVGKLHGAKSLFTVAPTPLAEWFDPAAQVYFATLFGERLSSVPAFRYERVLLLPSRRSRKYLDSDYLEGYFAKCLISIHKHLGISLYFLEWKDIARILGRLTPKEKVSIGYYPPFSDHMPEYLVKILLLPVRRKRVRRIAGGVIETSSGARRAFRFAKRENVVDVDVQPETRAKAYIKFVKYIKETLLYDDKGAIDIIHDFTKYYDV